MAEIIGIVQIRDAPHDLQLLLNDLEVFSEILADIEADIAEDTVASALVNSKHATKSLNLCKQAAENLESIAKGLSKELMIPGRFKKSYASVKVGLQKGKIEKLKQRLQGAGQLLQLSQQCYTRALLQVQPALIAVRLAASHAVTSKPEESCGKADELVVRSRPTNKQPQRRQSCYLWRLTLPSWMCSKALELAGMRVPAGWNWNFRVYNPIPNDSKVLKLVSEGDVQGLRELFASKQASPFDRVSFEGFWLHAHGDLTLLHVASMSAQPQRVLQFLLEQGCDPSLGRLLHRQNLPMTPLEYRGIISPPSRKETSTQARHRLFTILLRMSDNLLYEYEEAEVRNIFEYFRGPSDEFLLLQKYYWPSFLDLPSRVRITVAASIARFTRHNAVWFPQIIRTVLGDDIRELKSSVFENTRDDFSLVHKIAGQIGHSLAALQQYQYWNDNHPLSEQFTTRSETLDEKRLLCHDWSQLFFDLLDTGANTHTLENLTRHTPFVEFIFQYMFWWPNEGLQVRDWNPPVQRFMRDLKTAGIDLQEYGREERVIWTSDDVRREWNLRVRRGEPWNGLSWRLTGFKYGPMPEDWSVWIYEWNEYFTDFWRLVERPVETMPGTWLD